MNSIKVHLLRYAHPSSLRRSFRYASFLRTRKPCIWSFSRIHLKLRVVHLGHEFNPEAKAHLLSPRPVLLLSHQLPEDVPRPLVDVEKAEPHCSFRFEGAPDHLGRHGDRLGRQGSEELQPDGPSRCRRVAVQPKVSPICPVLTFLSLTRSSFRSVLLQTVVNPVFSMVRSPCTKCHH